MRFKKGSQVEVLSKKEVSIGSWRSAEIISGNGHTYSVKYGWFPWTQNPEVERVPRKVIRPCPQRKEKLDCVRGDVVEVFHDLSWKTATVVESRGPNTFLVRLHVLSDEFIAHTSYLRVRQCWKDDQWFDIGKASERSRKVEHPVGNPMLTVKTLKRRTTASGSCEFDLYNEASRKRRAIQNGTSNHQGINSFIPSQNFLQETYRTLNDDSHSTVSSVGSCDSSGNTTYNIHSGSRKVFRNSVEDDGSDTESFCGRYTQDQMMMSLFSQPLLISH